MPVVRRIFEMIGAEGQSLWAVKKILERERVPTPSGARYWSQAFLRICVQNDAYRPHPYEEVVDLVSEEVAAKLDPGRSYGIWWYGKQRHVQKQSSTIGPNGERSYRKSKRSTWNPKDEWIASTNPGRRHPLPTRGCSPRKPQGEVDPETLDGRAAFLGALRRHPALRRLRAGLL
jgi:hypothetical protein